jgi:[ribosomal protein S5]-alanine N-acetyltransferase
MSYHYKDGLRSDRLLTRFLTADDSEEWISFLENPEATKFFPATKVDVKERSIDWIQRQLDRYAKSRYGLQALVNQANGEFIGQCGLLAQTVDGVGEIEVGYHILPSQWGRGYAPEAAKLFLDYAFSNHISDTAISIIHTGNLRSQRVAEKNGLKRDKRTVYNDGDVYIYRISKG